MTDFMTAIQRSRAMSAVRSTETKIEETLQTELHRRGFRFRKNVKDLPGRPDVVLAKYHCIIFVHGCFWHQHRNCNRAKLPKTNESFWMKKIADNVTRDKKQVRALRRSGWTVITIWECRLKNAHTRDVTIENLIRKLQALSGN